MFWNTANKLEPKRQFFKKIEAFYLQRGESSLPKDLIVQIAHKITHEVYADYKRLWKKHPKSRKRYSQLDLKDLDHNYVRNSVIDFLELKQLPERHTYAKALFDMDDEAYTQYLDWKEWYETK